MREQTPKSRRRSRLAALLGAIALYAAAAADAMPAGASAPLPVFEDPARLAAAAEAEGARELGRLPAGERLDVGAVAPGLRLRRCEHAIAATRAPGLRVPGRALVELRCPGPQTWHLYVPVRVVGVAEVVLAAHAIVPGTVLRSADLRVERRDLAGLPPGYLDSASIAVGLTAARPIAGGELLTNQMLLGRTAVRRGQTVTLVADAGGVRVEMGGRALSDGLVNQRVKVENLSSGKIVEGIARSDQTVEILVP